MYSNLLKAGWVVCDGEEKHVIDSNNRMNKILEELRSKELPEGFSPLAASAREVSAEGVLGGEAAALFADTEESFAEGEFAQEMPVEEPIPAGPTPEELLAQAREEAEQIRLSAMEEAEQLKSQAFEEGRQNGYDAGYREGMEQIQRMEQAVAEKEQVLERQYRDKIDELEPQFVEQLNRIYERVFDVKFGEQKDLILHLLTNAMREIDENKDFILHISPEDYKQVREAKALLSSESLVGNATVEIIEDMTLAKNECLIETGGGVFDCSLGTQLKQLQKELSLLSYQK